MTAQTCFECAFFKRGYRLQGMKVPDFCTRHHHSQRADDPACTEFKETTMTDITTPAQMREAAALLPCPFCGGEASAEGYQKWSKPVLNVTWDGGDPITEAYFCNCPTCCVSNITSGIGYRTRAEAIANWNRRALPVAEAAPVAVKVKPLEFEGRNGFWRAADGLGGFYEICEVNGGFHMTRITLGVGSAFVTYPTIDAAQAAANADHAARILSQIEAVSVAQVRAEALREAEKALRDWQDDLNVQRMPDAAITVGMAADVVGEMMEKPTR